MSLELIQLIESHGLKINGFREGAGKFRDIEIGVGADINKLIEFKKALEAKTRVEVNITRVTNTDHEEFGKPYVEVRSWWWEL